MEPETVLGPEVDLRSEAVRRLKKKRDFRAHLVAYVLVNALLWAIWGVVWFTSGVWFPWPLFAPIRLGHWRGLSRLGCLRKSGHHRRGDPPGGGSPPATLKSSPWPTRPLVAVIRATAAASETAHHSAGRITGRPDGVVPDPVTPRAGLRKGRPVRSRREPPPAAPATPEATMRRVAATATRSGPPPTAASIHPPMRWPGRLHCSDRTSPGSRGSGLSRRVNPITTTTAMRPS